MEKVNNQNSGMGFRIKYLLWLIVEKISFRIYRLAKEREAILSSINNLQKDIKNDRLDRSGYIDHYSEQIEVGVLNRYKNEFLSHTPRESEVVFRAEHVRNAVLSLAGQDPELKNFVNFGCSYGWLEHQISSRLPNLNVFGVDRSNLAMQMNRDEFGSPNCNFVASDIFEFISDRKDAISDSVFCHINVGVYFLPKFIMKLYSALHDAGTRYIVAFEPSGLSRQTHHYYQYSFARQDPVVFRGPMLINNYPNLMMETGFDLIDANILRPPHPQSDFRSICLVSRRRQ